jgi:hypothetical protein
VGVEEFGVEFIVVGIRVVWETVVSRRIGVVESIV